MMRSGNSWGGYYRFYNGCRAVKNSIPIAGKVFWHVLQYIQDEKGERNEYAYFWSKNNT